jgi:hypothetical protein
MDLAPINDYQFCRNGNFSLIGCLITEDTDRYHPLNHSFGQYMLKRFQEVFVSGGSACGRDSDMSCVREVFLRNSCKRECKLDSHESNVSNPVSTEAIVQCLE